MYRSFSERQFSSQPKLLAATAAALLIWPGPAAAHGKDFTVILDGTNFEINVGETITARTANGQSVALKLERKATTTFRSPRITFDHPSTLSVASTSIEQDIRQHLLATATGTIVIVQEYGTFDPAPLAQLMLMEFTKDDVRGGGKLASDVTVRKLIDGTEISGLKATVTRKAEVTKMEVLTYGNSGQGVVLITRIDAENTKADQPVLDELWRTLKMLPVAE